MSSMITGANHERRLDASSAHEEYPLQPMQQEGDDDDDDVSAEDFDPHSPNEHQGADNTASSAENLGHLERQESSRDQEMSNMSLRSLRSVSSNALDPGNAVLSASNATSQSTLKNVSAWSFCLRFWRYGWNAEGFGCAIAALSLMAICIILRVHANKPLPGWPYGITINALIAIFTVVLKVGVVLPLSEAISQSKWQAFQSSPRLLIDIEDFDAASRGPWGSAQFLFKIDKTRSTLSWRKFWKLPFTLSLKRRNVWYYFAKFSALLTIVAFAVDPFSQQLVEFISCAQPLNSISTTISRTNTYVRASGHLGAGQNEIDGPMAVAINRGINDPPQNASILVTASCATGNCTFPPYSTIGLCHSVHDLSEKVHVSGASSKDPFFDPNRNITLDMGTGSLITLGPFNTLNNTVLQTKVSETGSGIFELYMLMDNTYRLTPSPESTGNVSAFSAEIYPCVRTYNASVRDSALSETELSSTPIGINQNSTQTPQYLFLLATSRTWVNGTLVECQPRQEKSTGTVEVFKDNVDAAPGRWPDEETEQQSLWYPKECVWRFGQNSMFAIQGALATSLGDLRASYTMRTVTGPIAAKSIWRNGTATLTSVSQFMQGLTDTMTATMRTHGDEEGESAYAHGEAFTQSTCAHIRWAWLSYHITLVALTASSLILMLVFNPPGNNASTVWKSSSLAVLFCSIDESLKGKTRFDMGKDEMLRVAQTMSAQLVMDANGRARFV